MTKKNKTFFDIFLQGIGLYFSNILKFLRYMLYPVFGQLLGVITIYYFMVLCNQLLPGMLDKYPALGDILYINIIIFIFLLPGLCIYLSALWKYLIAYSAITSMTDNLLKSDRVYDFPAHNMLVTRKWFSYLILWMIYGSVILLTTIPIFWIIGGILLVYFTFIFSIFIFEENTSPIDCFKKSSVYVHKDFWKIVCLIGLIGMLTYLIIPQIIYTLLNISNITSFLTNFVAAGIETSALYNINLIMSLTNHSAITPEVVGEFIVRIIIFITIIQLLLPLRSICIYLWYKNHCNDNDVVRKADEKFLKKIKKGR